MFTAETVAQQNGTAGGKQALMNSPQSILRPSVFRYIERGVLYASR